jgi:hypothetical protein
MLIKLIYHMISLCNVTMFKFDYIFLNLSADLCENQIIMPLMPWQTQTAIKLFVDFAAIFDLSVFVLLTEELAWVIIKCLLLIKHLLILFLLLRSWQKLLKRLCWMHITVIKVHAIHQRIMLIKVSIKSSPKCMLVHCLMRCCTHKCIIRLTRWLSRISIDSFFILIIYDI